MNTQLDNRFHKLEVAMRQVQGDVDDMKKITKKELNERLLMVETLLGLHRVLPEQISNKQANDAIFRMQCALSSGKELAGRKPKLKQLDQSVFDGEPEQIKWAMVTSEGAVLKLEFKPVIKDGLWYWIGGCRQHSLIGQYDASNWQNSLIERESVELTGSDLARAMLERGDRCVPCDAYDGEEDWKRNTGLGLIVAAEAGCFICASGNDWMNAIPINPRTGEPLTQSDVGL